MRIEEIKNLIEREDLTGSIQLRKNSLEEFEVFRVIQCHSQLRLVMGPGNRKIQYFKQVCIREVTSPDFGICIGLYLHYSPKCRGLHALTVCTMRKIERSNEIGVALLETLDYSVGIAGIRERTIGSDTQNVVEIELSGSVRQSLYNIVFVTSKTRNAF